MCPSAGSKTLLLVTEAVVSFGLSLSRGDPPDRSGHRDPRPPRAGPAARAPAALPSGLLAVPPRVPAPRYRPGVPPRVPAPRSRPALPAAPRRSTAAMAPPAGPRGGTALPGPAPLRAGSGVSRRGAVPGSTARHWSCREGAVPQGPCPPQGPRRALRSSWEGRCDRACR